jgi:AraC-like DNA-binding protein
MLNASLVLVGLVILILLKNHFKKNKGITYAIIALPAVLLKVVVEAFPFSYFDQHSLFLQFVLISPIINFLIAPLVLLYIDTVLTKSLTLNRYFLLLVPFFFFLINFIPFFSLSIEEKIQIYSQANYASTQPYFIWFSFPVLRAVNNFYNPLIGIITMAYLFQILIRNKQKLSKKTYLNLLQVGIILIVNFIAIRSIMFYHYISNGQNISPEILGILAILAPLSFILLPNWLYDNSIDSDLNLYFRLMNRIPKNEGNNDLIKSEIITDSTKIISYLNEEKPYLSPGFSIHDLVSHLDIPQKNVTDCFNKVIKIPFPRLRNQLRIEYAMEMFKNNAHLKNSISGVASDAGFKNRATFYIAFKEVAKMTPIEWINENCDTQVQEDFVDESSENDLIKVKASSKQILNFKDER